MKKRLDVLLVERGLAESRAQAQALVLAGRVPGYEKAGQQVDESAELTVTQPPRFVSRGGEKLAHALEDGDVLFAVSTGAVDADPLLDTTALGVVASEVAWDAVLSVVPRA